MWYNGIVLYHDNMERQYGYFNVGVLHFSDFVIVSCFDCIKVGALQDRVRESQLSTKDHHEILKSELARRDETIQKLRRDVLSLQEKRDAAVEEVNILPLNYVHMGRISLLILNDNKHDE